VRSSHETRSCSMARTMTARSPVLGSRWSRPTSSKGSVPITSSRMRSRVVSSPGRGPLMPEPLTLGALTPEHSLRHLEVVGEVPERTELVCPGRRDLHHVAIHRPCRYGDVAGQEHLALPFFVLGRRDRTL